MTSSEEPADGATAAPGTRMAFTLPELRERAERDAEQLGMPDGGEEAGAMVIRIDPDADLSHFVIGGTGHGKTSVADLLRAQREAAGLPAYETDEHGNLVIPRGEP